MYRLTLCRRRWSGSCSIPANPSARYPVDQQVASFDQSVTLPIDGDACPAHHIRMPIDALHAQALEPRKRIREGLSWKSYHKHRYFILFYTLLFALVAMPVAAFAGWDARAIEVLLGLVLLTAIMPLGSKKSRFIVLAGIMLVLAARPVTQGLNNEGLSDTALGLWALVGLSAAAGALRFMLTAEEIASEHIYAALSAYLLAGVFFGMAYWVIEQIWPGSFGGPAGFTRETAVYFSFVTLASLGYGDFLPTNDLTRGLVVFEVVGGQLFLAVMVARLIGLYTDQRE